MPKQHEITGTFLGERFVFENGGDSPRVIIGEIEIDGGERVTIKGECQAGQLRPDLPYRFWGHNSTYFNKRTGQPEVQFKFDNFIAETPATREAVVAYLRQCRGIGPATGHALFNSFGSDAVRVLREEPERATKAAPRLTLEKAQEASDFLSLHQSIERAKMDLMGLLHGRGLPKKTVEKIIEFYGSSAAMLIRRNPYLLMQFKGCGFLKADKLYLELGPQYGPERAKHAGRMKRQALCVWHSIAKSGSGDTWYHVNTARKSLERNIAGTEVDFDRAMSLALRAGLIRDRRDSMGSRWIAESRKADAEDRVAQYVAAAKEEKLLDDDFSGNYWPPVDSLGLDPVEDAHQIDNLRLATQGMIGVLGGSPGTGKTHCSALLIKAVIDMVGAENVAVAAPTGKAAVRLTEAMTKSKVSKKAQTIHGLLKVETSDGEFSFFYGFRNPLPFLYVIIDEGSMIDTSLMASLLAARGPQTRILFVGDTNQLAPVGHGAPLRDLIAAGVPTGTLTEIRRNSGRIVKACAEIRDQHRISVGNQLDLNAGENLALIECESPEQQIATLEAVMKQLQHSPEKKYDPIWDVQILVAVNKKSPLGRKPLNRRLQELLNPHGQRAPGSPFRVADKLIDTKNGWLPSVGFNENANDEGKVYCANGEQGEVLEVETNKTIVRMSSPDRVILIPRGTQDDRSESDESDSGDANARPEEEENREETKTGTGCSWELAYGISGHKSQGSEWPVVIVMIDEHQGAKMVCTRNWIYTAISRGKVFCLLIGKRTVLDEMCHRDGLRRKTFLVERIREAEGRNRPKASVDSDIAQATEATEWTEDTFRELLVGVL